VSAAPDPARSGRAPLLCLHGFGGLGAAWAPVAACLPPDVAVLAPDLPGHGRAEAWNGRAPARSFAESALLALDRHGVAAAHWVGHSLGGAAAILAALSAPERTLSLTLLAPGGMGEAISSQRLRRWAEARNEAEIEAAFAGMAADGAALPSPTRAALARDRREPGRAEALLGMTEKLAAGDRQGVIPPDRLAALPMPVSVLWGEADPVLPFGQTANLPPAWSLTPLPGRGHMLIEEAPFEAAKLLMFRLG
jgi:pyruvate dehydrogenase E2 component (dihydrolipoamide acetyltransferase)